MIDSTVCVAKGFVFDRPVCRGLAVTVTADGKRACGQCVPLESVQHVAPAAVTPAPPRKNTKGGDKPRIPGDAYYTPDPLAVAIARHLRFKLSIVPQVMIEPSAGEGAFVRAARAVWGNVPHIIAVESDRPRNFMRLDAAGADEVLYGRWEDSPVVPSRGYEDTILILGNPPFDVYGATGSTPISAEAHLELALSRLGHARERTPVPRFCAFLLRASFLATGARSRRQHMARGGLRWVRHLVDRPSFTSDNRTDAAEYVLCVYQAGFRGEYEGGWLDWNPPTMPG